MTRSLKLLAPLALSLLAAPLLSAQSTCGAGDLCGSSARECSAVCRVGRASLTFTTTSLLLRIRLLVGLNALPTATIPSTLLITSRYSGDGTQCLGGCNPLHSHSLDSCTPAPICADSTSTFNTLDRILTNYTMYEGNATTHDWVVDAGKVFLSNKNELVLTLTKDNNGTRISSRFYPTGLACEE